MCVILLCVKSHTFKYLEGVKRIQGLSMVSHSLTRHSLHKYLLYVSKCYESIFHLKKKFVFYLRNLSLPLFNVYHCNCEDFLS